MTYQVTIQMSSATAVALAQSKYFLYAFQAVQCSDDAGLPLVWLQKAEYAETTPIAWQSPDQAYTSFDDVVAGDQIQLGFSARVDTGQLLTVDQPTGSGTVGSGGPPLGIGVLNRTQTQFACGVAISQSTGAPPLPYCAFPLYGSTMQAFVPLPRVLLLFSTVVVLPGTAVSKAFNNGVLIHLDSSPQRSLNFDINEGWSWGGYAWAQSVSPNDDLVKLLIEHDPSLAALAREMPIESESSSPREAL